MVLQLFLINQVKSCLLISGLPGVLLAKSQWLITKKCLKREEVTGEIKSESLASALTRQLKPLLLMSRRTNGNLWNISIRLALLVLMIMELMVSLMSCLSIKEGR